MEIRTCGEPANPRAGSPHVVVVDDDDINRRGMAYLLAASPRVGAVTALSHREALEFTGWAGVDIVVVDAADPRRAEDQFPGVAVVEAVRGHPDSRVHPSGLTAAGWPVVVVVTGFFFDDAVRRRMREARADFFYHRAELADAAAFYAAVLGPRPAEAGIPPPVDPEEEFRRGVTDTTRVNRAVAYALTHGLEADLAARSEPRSRRWLRLRREFNDQARLTPVTSDGRRPDRTQQLPSLPQISRFLRWATKIKGPGAANRDDPDDEDLGGDLDDRGGRRRPYPVPRSTWSSAAGRPARAAIPADRGGRGY
jgi:DNA-binding NarL/FixJ family response regulator